MLHRGEYGAISVEERAAVESTRYTSPEDRRITLEVPGEITPDRADAEERLHALATKMGNIASALGGDTLKIQADAQVSPQARLQGVLDLKASETEVHNLAQRASDALGIVGTSWRVSRPISVDVPVYQHPSFGGGPLNLV